MVELLFKDEVYTLIGAAMDVYNELGSGFLEPVYQEAFELELLTRNIPIVPQKELTIKYKEQLLKKTYVADLVAYGEIIVEIKALERLSSREESQLINYLKATGMQLGLLINFGAKNGLEWKRMVNSKQPQTLRENSRRLAG